MFELSSTVGYHLKNQEMNPRASITMVGFSNRHLLLLLVLSLNALESQSAKIASSAGAEIALWQHNQCRGLNGTSTSGGVEWLAGLFSVPPQGVPQRTGSCAFLETPWGKICVCWGPGECKSRRVLKLMPSGYDLSDIQSAQTIGFFQAADGKWPGKLLERDVLISSCPESANKKMLCAVYEDGPAPARGDLVGPLMVKRHDGLWLVGLYKCSADGVDYYEDTSVVYDWIESQSG